MSNVWDLIKGNRYIEACEAADLEFSSSGSILVLRNKVLALLNLKRFSDAASLCRDLIVRTNGDTDTDFIFGGVSFWLLGQFGMAIKAWNEGTNTKYTDAAGGVEILSLLYFSSIRTGKKEMADDIKRRLHSLLSGPAIQNWPGPIAQFILGMTDDSQLLSSISAQAVLNAKQRCQAEFYIGVRSLSDGDLNRGLHHMRQACSQSVYSLVRAEYYLARSCLECSGSGDCKAES